MHVHAWPLSMLPFYCASIYLQCEVTRSQLDFEALVILFRLRLALHVEIRLFVFLQVYIIIAIDPILSVGLIARKTARK